MEPDGDYEAPSEETMMFARLEQERTNDGEDEWKRQYGFPHSCTCADDMESGNTTEIAECYALAAQEAFDALRLMRQGLLAIATSPSDDAYALKQFAHEMYHGQLEITEDDPA